MKRDTNLGTLQCCIMLHTKQTAIPATRHPSAETQLFNHNEPNICCSPWIWPTPTTLFKLRAKTSVILSCASLAVTWHPSINSIWATSKLPPNTASTSSRALVRSSPWRHMGNGNWPSPRHSRIPYMKLLRNVAFEVWGCLGLSEIGLQESRMWFVKIWRWKSNTEVHLTKKNTKSMFHPEVLHLRF